MKKVDFIYPYYYNATVGPAGTMRRILNNREYFSSQGYEVSVYLLDFLKGRDLMTTTRQIQTESAYNIQKGIENRNKIKSILNKYTLTSELFQFWRMFQNKRLVRKYLKLKREVDIVVFGDDDMCYSYIKSKATKSKVVLFEHSDGLNKSMLLKSYPHLSKYGIYRIMNRHFSYLLEYVDMFVFIAQIARNNFLELNNPFPANRTFFFHNGIDDREYVHKTNNSGTIKLCSTGTVSERKGQYLIIEAISTLEESVASRFSYNIIGTGNDVEQLKEAVREKGLNNIVNFMGNVPNDSIHDILLEQDIFILMSNNEGLPIAIIEALRAGLPIVSTNVAGIPELVTNNNGLIISRTTEAVKDVLINYDKYDWISMGRASRELFDEEFTFNSMMNNYIKLFNHCLL